MANYSEQGAADDRAISLISKASSELKEIEGLIEDGSRRAADAVRQGAGLAGRDRVADQVSEQIKFLVIDLTFVADDYVRCIDALLSQADKTDSGSERLAICLLPPHRPCNGLLSGHLTSTVSLSRYANQ